MDDNEFAEGIQRIWREENVEIFDATVVAAAEQLDVQPLAVEKDYWVCRALRALENDHSGSFVFKGGTSLEKMRIVERFSEDLDLLVTGDYKSLGDAKRAIKDMCQTVATSCGSELTDAVSGGSLGTAWRRVFVEPPLKYGGVVETAIADNRQVQLELGQSGGPSPSRRRIVESLLTRQLIESGFDDIDYLDLEPFETTVLDPGRTLLEKLMRVNDFSIRQDHHDWQRIGRQFYDIWALLGSEEVIQFFDDRGEVELILQDCVRVSEMYGGAEPIPEGGFAYCAAFDLSSSIKDRLQTEHESAMRDLYYGSGIPPTFEQTIARILEHREILAF